MSKWITGPEARAVVHRLRAAHDCVLTGSGTVISDDPQLTVRLEGQGRKDVGKQPLRAVIDRRGRIPASARLFAAPPVSPVLVFGRERPRGLSAAVEFEGSAETYWTPAAVLEVLGGRGVESVMLECGAELAASFMAAGLIDRIEWFRAPLIIGGDGLPALGTFDLTDLAEAPRYRLETVARLGPDLHETYLRA